jgi:hypothetical protein
MTSATGCRFIEATKTTTKVSSPAGALDVSILEQLIIYIL